MAGMVRKTSGDVSIWGFDIDRDRRNAAPSASCRRKSCSIRSSPRSRCWRTRRAYGIPKAERLSEQLLADVHLSDKAKAYARTLSGGMKRRLLVAKAMVHQPRCWFWTNRRRAWTSNCGASFGNWSSGSMTRA
jgi:ABC-2 type transport system ATP-binding protein